MNDAQKTILFIAAVVAIGMLAYPPMISTTEVHWSGSPGSVVARTQVSTKYDWLTSGETWRINWGVLGIQMVILALAAGLLVWLCKSAPAKPITPESAPAKPITPESAPVGLWQSFFHPLCQVILLVFLVFGTLFIVAGLMSEDLGFFCWGVFVLIFAGTLFAALWIPSKDRK